VQNRARQSLAISKSPSITHRIDCICGHVAAIGFAFAPQIGQIVIWANGYTRRAGPE
jgi:hypothetical protein